MKWHKRHKRGYHHGNLRQALVEAALDLIGSKGTGGFTFAEAARHAGVSPAAPYRHFKDRDALLADVATQGFAAFSQTVDKVRGSGTAAPLRRLNEMGRAYLAFAREQPAFYSAMFESGLDYSGYPDLRQAADESFATLRSTVEEIIEGLPAGNRPPAMMATLHVWAISHGIASLFGRADGAGFKQPIAPEDLLESQLLLYLEGIKASSRAG